MESAIAPGFENLTVEAVSKSLEADKIAEISARVDESVVRKKMQKQKEPPPQPKVRMPDFKAVERANEKVQEENEKIEKKRVIRKVRQYLNSDILGLRLKHIKAPAVGDTLEYWQACENDIHSTLNTVKAKETLWGYMENAALGMEWLIAKFPEKFGDINITNPIRFKDIIASTELQHQLREEVEEITIEYPQYFETGPVRRFAQAIAAQFYRAVQFNRMNGQNASEVKQEMGQLFQK